nr:MAG TPA: hypothetical protein [Caudoviricetes sp.]
MSIFLRQKLLKVKKIFSVAIFGAFLYNASVIYNVCNFTGGLQ